MTTRDEVISKLWHGRDPVPATIDPTAELDDHGWNSQHPYLTEAMESRPDIVVEVGVWKGASVLTMASRLKALEAGGVVIAVDTWLGSWDHWLDDTCFNDLHFRQGYPQLYYTFLTNVVLRGLGQQIVPLPLDSNNARYLMLNAGLLPDVVHIDAGHDKRAVTNDLELWWGLLKPSGLMICDDYCVDEKWPEVREAVDHFFARVPHEAFETDGGGKCRVRKPGV